VALACSGVLFAVAWSFLFTVSRTRFEADARVETRQAVQASLDTMVRDVRLAGACLPTVGSFVSLAGTNTGTTRIGSLDSSLLCVRAILTAATATGATSLPVDTTAGFAADTRVFVFNGNVNGAGELATVRSVSSSPARIVLTGGTSQAYPVNTAVFGITERVYSIGTAPDGTPTLLLAIDGRPAEEFARGLQALNVRYRLEQNCPACDVVDLPSTTAQWRLVKEVLMSVTASFAGGQGKARPYVMDGDATAKPRNLIP
jgi:hypothetical protein